MRTPQLPDSWLAGIISMPSYVTGEGPPYRPDILLFMAGDFVLGTHVGRPGELFASAADALRSTMRAPMVGKPSTPRSVRAWPAALADALRAALPDTISVTCAPVPELDGVAQSMSEQLSAGQAQTVLPPGVSSESFAAFFRAAARLHRARPWDAIPGDTDLITVSCPALGLHDAVVSVIGRLGQNFGFVLFSSYDDFDTWLQSVDRGSHDLPHHLVLNYEPRKDVPKWVRDELRQLGCEVAAPDATPWLGVIGPDLVERPAAHADYARAEAVAAALAALTEQVEPLAACWQHHVKLERVVPTPRGEVTVSAPFGYVEARDGDFNLNQSLLDASGELDDGTAEAYAEALLERFARSSEAAALGAPLRYADLVIDLAARVLGLSAAQLLPHHVRDLLHEVIPRRVSVGPSVAEPMVRELRAFFRFLHRQWGLRTAELCLRRALAPGVEPRVRASLEDTSGYGLAKSFILEGAAAGFDLSTEEGLARWVEAANAGSRGHPMAAPPSRPPTRDKKKKKKKHKARAAAPRRNRRA